MRKLWLAIAASALCALASAAAAEAAGKQRIVVEERSASYGFAIDCSPFGPWSSTGLPEALFGDGIDAIQAAAVSLPC